MKSTFLSLMILTGLLISSCHKHTSNMSNNGGSWTIRNNTYNADSCIFTSAGANYPAVMAAQTVVNPANLSAYSQLFIQFGAPPVSSGTYTLVGDSIFVNGVMSPTQAYVTCLLTLIPGSGLDYSSSGTGSMSVVVSSTGKVSASSATGIEMLNTGNPNDSAKLVFNVAQTN